MKRRDKKISDIKIFHLESIYMNIVQALRHKTVKLHHNTVKLRHKTEKTGTKLALCDLAIYSLLAGAVTAGILALPYSLWLVFFRDGSFARLLGAIVMCITCWGGMRCMGFFKQRIYYVDSLCSYGFTREQASQAWDDFLHGRHDALKLHSTRQAPTSPSSKPTDKIRNMNLRYSR